VRVPAAPAMRAPAPQAPAPAPATPPPPPPVVTSTGDAPEKSRRTWRLLVGIGAALLVVVAILLWMVVYGFSLFQRTVVAVPAQVALAAAPGPATQTMTALPPAAVTTVVAAVVTPNVSTGHPPVTSTGTVAVVAPVPAPAVAGTPIVATAVTRTNPPPAASPAVEALKLPLVWPRLTVSGLMGGGRTRSTVIVNGQMLTQGDTVDGAKIIAIEKHGVTFTFSGETRTLAVGTSTE